jgi:hypothetical protein
MTLIRIDRNPPRRQLALFGASWLVFFGLLGAMLYDAGRWWPAAALWSVAVTVPAVGWLVPAVLRLAYLGTAYAGFPIGYVVSHVLLAAIYYLVLTPTGLVMRLCGRDPLCRRFDREASSYWQPRRADERLARYFRQF